MTVGFELVVVVVSVQACKGRGVMREMGGGSAKDSACAEDQGKVCREAEEGGMMAHTAAASHVRRRGAAECDGAAAVAASMEATGVVMRRLVGVGAG